MSLLCPTPGEIADRIAIVQLKIVAALSISDPKIRFRFESELLELLGRQSEIQKSADALLSRKLVRERLDSQRRIFVEMQSVHQKLWELEDQRRDLMSRVYIEVLEVSNNAVLTTKLNDHRQSLIRQMNALYDVHEVEKLYEYRNSDSSNAADGSGADKDTAPIGL